MTGLRRLIAACTSWKPVAAGPGPGAPAASTPPSAARQEIAAWRPAAWSMPRAPPSLVTTPPDRIAAVAYRRRAATIRPGRDGAAAAASVCSQLSQRTAAASAVARTSASGSCLGSHWPIPVNAALRCSSRPGCPAMLPR